MTYRHIFLFGFQSRSSDGLANAHAKLDAAVFAAYGWPADLADDELLARLLKLNLERSQ